MIDNTSFASPFSTTSGSAEMRSGIAGSAKVSDSLSLSSSLLMIIARENLQRPRTRQEKRDGCEIAAQLFAGVADCIEITSPHEHRQLDRSVVAHPAMLRRARNQRL